MHLNMIFHYKPNILSIPQDYENSHGRGLRGVRVFPLSPRCHQGSRQAASMAQKISSTPSPVLEGSWLIEEEYLDHVDRKIIGK